jgi:hypothetical protein
MGETPMNHNLGGMNIPRSHLGVEQTGIRLRLQRSQDVKESVWIENEGHAGEYVEFLDMIMYTLW